MPRIQLSASLGKASATFTCDTAEQAPSTRPKSFGFGEGVCTCARCMRKAGPIREDVEERLIQIAYVLAGVFVDTPNPDELVKEEHRKSALEFMNLVEEGNVAKLNAIFDLLEGEGMVEEIATELIISAAQLGQAEVIRLLADKGADIEERDLRRGGRPLMHAANNGHTPAVKTLIEAGADLEARDDNGYTALMVAIFSDRSSAAEALLQAGAQVDAVDDKGRTALSYAALYGSTDCIYLLASNGANVFTADRDGANPLELAEDSGRASAVEALKKLQMKVRMQERRRQRQKPQQAAACPHLDDGQLAARTAAAAQVAEQLLREIEDENTRKVAKAKKKHNKKGAAGHNGQKAKGAQGGSGPAGSSGGPSSAANGGPNSPQGSAASGNGPGRDGKGGWDDNCGASGADISGAGQSTDLSHTAHPHTPDGLPGEVGLRDIGGSDGPASGPGSLCHTGGDEDEEVSAAAEVDVAALRGEWDTLVDAASGCVEEARQPKLAGRMEAMLPRVAEAGISVKYGRKVLQRLLNVCPAREELRAALAARPPSRPSLERALSGCRGVRSLLDPKMVQDAETLVERLRQEEETRRWNNLASALSWDPREKVSRSSVAGAAGSVGGMMAPVPPLASHAALASSGMADDCVDPANECVVCLSSSRNVCVIPCGHVCMCRDCASDVQLASGQCPLCRAGIECVIEILN